jgi:hypothetical protein
MAVAGLRQPHPAGVALDERCPGLAFERRDLLRDRRLGDVQRLRGGGERTAGRDLAEDAETSDIEHRATTYHVVLPFMR